jgi:hypothetical protein
MDRQFPNPLMQENRNPLSGSGRLVGLGSTMGHYRVFTPLPRDGIGTVTFEVRSV